MVRENHLLVLATLAITCQNQTSNTWQMFLNYEISQVAHFTNIKHSCKSVLGEQTTRKLAPQASQSCSKDEIIRLLPVGTMKS